ncbi:unnamed protein product, partial [Closterium sp. NIES-53]
DHFLALDPTVLTVDLLEQHLLAAETSVVNVGAACGTPRTPFFEGCSPSPLAPSYASAATVDVLGAEDVVAASASRKRRSSKGKGGRGGGGGSGGGGGGSSGGGGGSGGGGSVVGVVAGVGALAEAVVAAVGLAVVAAVGVVVVGLELLSGEVLAVARGSSSSVGARPRDCAGQTCGKPHTQHCYFSRLEDAWRAEFGDEAERPRWAELLRSGVAIFDLDYDAILAAMYALSVSAEGDCYLCVPPDPGIEAAALGVSESALPGTAPAEALHTFTLDSVLARSSTVLLCPALPSGSLSGLHLPSFSTNLMNTDALRDAMVTTTTPGGQRVSICTCTRTGRHLATFTRRPGSSLYTLVTETLQTLLWHHRLGHPSLPRLRGMHSRLFVSGLPGSLATLLPSLAPPCLPCVEGRQQRAAPHSSSFPPTTAPLQTLQMDVWGPARGEVPNVLIPWIRAVRFQLRERFRQDLPILRLHSDRGGEFSSDLLRDFSRGEGILKSFTLPTSLQQNGIAERRIGLVMEVTRTFMIHADAPHFLWPVAVRYAAPQLNLWPRVSLPETSPTLRWTEKDVTFDESVPVSRLFPYRSAPPPPPPLFPAPVRCLLPRPGLVLHLPPGRVVLCRTRLSFGTTALVTPLYLVFERAAPHSSTFPPTEAPLQNLHMDVWGPARVRGQGHERYFLLVVDDYSRYTTVFPLRSKGETFMLPASPQQNGIAERRIGMVMDVARTSMIHAAAPHFLWPFAVQYTAHQINLQPRVSLPETTPTLQRTGKVGDASVFRVWGS